MRVVLAFQVPREFQICRHGFRVSETLLFQAKVGAVYSLRQETLSRFSVFPISSEYSKARPSPAMLSLSFSKAKAGHEMNGLDSL